MRKVMSAGGDHNSALQFATQPEGARATLAGVELWPMIKNGQLDNPECLSVWDEFYALAA
jgi:hypothetical protein